MNHMGQSLNHKYSHAQIILLICPEHPMQNSLLEPCLHKTDMRLGAGGKLKLGVAPAQNREEDDYNVIVTVTGCIIVTQKIEGILI
jgi:hypothetical protein